MRDLVFKLVLDADGTIAKLERVDESLDQLKEKGEEGSVYKFETDANGKIHAVKRDLEDVQDVAEQPTAIKITAEQALGTIRDVKIALDGLAQIVKGVTAQVNQFLDANLKQKQAMQLANHVFGESAAEMARFASEMQKVTNFGDESLIPLMAKLQQTFKLNQDEIKALTPLLLDFTEANKATGMSVESAFDLMGRAVNGHTEMLGRYGIELDATRLKTEGVSYLVEKLGEDYGGTAIALADLRTQNANAWGDIKEEIGAMLETMITPILKGIRAMINVYNELSPVMKGFVAGIGIAIPAVATLAAGITTLIAAISALKVAINPITGTISLAVGALTILGFGLAAASMKSTEFTEAQKSVADEIKGCNLQVQAQAESFNILSSRLLELRSATNLTASGKTELKGLITSMNEQYGDYIGNIDLATAAQSDLELAINRTSAALIKQAVAEAYGTRYKERIDQVAALTVAYNDAMQTYRAQAREMQEQTLLAAGPGAARQANVKINPLLQQVMDAQNQLSLAKGELEKFRTAYYGAVEEMTALFSPGSAEDDGSGSGSQSALLNSQIAAEATRLIAELARIRQTETEQLEAEYDRRLAIIQSYLAQGSAEEKAALDDLDAWKTTKEADITAREKAGIQARFESEVSHLANLRELGISSYDQLKAKMDEYYQWAKANLPEEEAALVLKQVQEVNLRWGRHQKDKEDRELSHQRRLEDIRREFIDSGISAEDRAYNAKLVALQRYFEDNKEIMLQAGLTSEQITKAQAEAEEKITAESEARKRQIREQNASMALSKTSGLLGRLGDMQDKESRRGFETWKAMSMAQAYVDMSAGILGAFRSQISIPIIGPILAAAEAAVAAAFGMKQIANIKATKFEPTKAATGGLLSGPSHSHGGILIEAEGDEYITAKDRVRALGKGLFDFLNFAPLDQVKAAFANLALPSLSIPPTPAFAFASGGSVASSPPSLSILEAINDKMALLVEKNVHFEIHVDPLADNPVKVSEIAEQGTIIRSSF